MDFGNMTAGGFMGFPSVGGTIFNAAEANAAEAYNSNQVQGQNNFQMYMSDTAYQRQVADMKAAGINPILAAATGGGASTPSGGLAQAAIPNFVNLPDMYKAFQTDRQLDQADKQLGINAKTAAASAAKDMSQKDLNMTDALLKSEGIAGREFGTGGVQKFKDFMNSIYSGGQGMMNNTGPQSGQAPMGVPQP